MRRALYLPAPSVSSAVPRAWRGSVLLIVLVTIVFATAALTLFIEKAGNDLIVEVRAADAVRMRMEAYSALETTLSVLEEFRQVNNGLHSPAEGWADPLGFAGYEPAAGRTVEVTFNDESGKIPLSSVEATTLVELFKGWEMPQPDAERLADALLGWMKKDYVATSASAPRAEDYDRGDLPFAPPQRSLRAFSELGSIDLVRQVFYDEAGRPNALWRRFENAFSLYKFKTPNINGGYTDALVGYDAAQQQRIRDYLAGTGTYKAQGPGYFKSSEQIAAVAGGQAAAGASASFGTTVSALRVIITVRDGRTSSFRLNAVVAPPNGADVVGPSEVGSTTVSGDAANSAQSANKSSSQASQPGVNGSSGTNADPNAKKLQYPFKLLEIRENDANSAAPAPAEL